MVRLGKFGPVVQRGDNDDPKKDFSSLRKGQSIETITLEEALKLFELPREVGKWKDDVITAAIGRFGPYVKYGSKFVSLGKLYDPYTITEDEACALIEDHIQKEANKVIRFFEKEDIQILNGRFGPYIKCGKNNFKIPKGKNAKKAEELTLEDCQNIIKNSEPTGGGKNRKK